MKNLKKEEIKSLIREAIDKANLEEGWLDRLKARALSMGKSKENKALSRAMTILKGFEKQAVDSLMDLQQLTGDDAQTQNLIKSVEESMTEVIARIEDVSRALKDEMVGNKWLDKGPSKKDLEAFKDEEPEAEEYEPDSETGEWSARKRQDIEAKRLKNYKRKMAMKRRQAALRRAQLGLPPRKGDAELLAPMRGLRGRPAGQARKRKLAQARASAARVPRPMTEDRNE